MLQIELVPDLSHCIETVAKKEYEGTLKQLLASEEINKELEEKAEILRLFLQTADFKKLRAKSEKFLIEGKAVKFVIYEERGALKYAIQVLSNSQDLRRNI
jgi:hypothetical protein